MARRPPRVGTSTSACVRSARRRRASLPDVRSWLRLPCFPLSPFYIAKGVSSSVRNAPNFSRAVVGDEQRSVGQHEKTGWPSPNLPPRLSRHPAGDEVVVAAARVAVFERNAYDFV